MLGSSYLRRGDLDRAQVEFKRAINSQPTFVSAHYNLALVFQKEGQTDNAAEELKAALKIDPRYTAARRELNSLETSPH